MAEQPILTHARLGAQLGPRAFHATLPNGKPVVAHLPARATPAAPLHPGQLVRVALTPYDFDHARIEGAAADPCPPPQPRT